MRPARVDRAGLARPFRQARHALARRVKGAVWGAADAVSRFARALPDGVGDGVRAALLAAAQVGAVLLGVPRGPRSAVEAVFPSPPSQLSQVHTWALAALIESHQNVSKALANQSRVAGNEWVERGVVVRGRAILDRLAREGRPVVAVVWHAGLVAALPSALAQCGRKGLMLQRFDYPDPVSGFAVVGTGSLPHEGARGLLRAVKALRAGDTVIVVAGIAQDDVPHEQAPFLGRTIRVAPGTAVMARLAGAVLVPVEARTTLGRMTVEVFEPVPQGATDRATTLALVAFFAERIAAHPASLWRNELLRLVQSPAR